MKKISQKVSKLGRNCHQLLSSSVPAPCKDSCFAKNLPGVRGIAYLVWFIDSCSSHFRESTTKIKSFVKVQRSEATRILIRTAHFILMAVILYHETEGWRKHNLFFNSSTTGGWKWLSITLPSCKLQPAVVTKNELAEVFFSLRETTSWPKKLHVPYN